MILRNLIFSLLLAGASAAGTEVLLDRSGNPVRYAGTVQGGKVVIPRVYTPRAGELRGVWVTTVENLDIGVHDSAAAYRKTYGAILRQLAAKKFTAVFFQVRPTNDAFYPSKFNPWSRWLAGSEGRGISGFDPLQYMLNETKRNGMEFHAWLNPYRVAGRTKLAKNAYLATLSPDNFARKNPSLVLTQELGKGERALFLNPGEPAVIRHILNTVGELVTNYDVDAIHFDDYFYPYEVMGEADGAAYRKYGRGAAIADWRRNNVNKLIRGVHMLIAAHNKERGKRVQFGVSPFGIWANKKSNPLGSSTAGKESLIRQYADTRSWVKNNDVDYIVPQIYWPFGHDIAAYAALADWWAAAVRGTNVKLYIGLGVYNLGSNSLWQDPAEIANQIRYNAKHPEIKGAVFFRCKHILEPSNAIMKSGVGNIFSDSRRRAAEPQYPRFP